MHSAANSHHPQALLFDMDGTLTEPLLDFPRIKAEMGIGQRPILEALAEMDEADRQAAAAVLIRHEEIAAANSSLNPGCVELLEHLTSHGLRSALITRNSRRSVQTFIDRHGLKIDVLIARDDAPAKPDPRPLWLACQRLGVAPSDAWMVGDGRYDVEAGGAAGVRTVWISHGRRRDFDAAPWRETAGLPELLQLLIDC